jgi:purine nucleosidase
MRRFWIDTDTASDDAIALLMAFMSRDVVIDAVSVTAGNVPLPQAVQNALYTVELAGAAVPVFVGRHAPFLRAAAGAESVHGNDGMGDCGLALHSRRPSAGHAADQLIERIMAAPGTYTLVTLGPLSTIALALLREPALAQAVQRCVVMGGTSDGHGNVTAAAEYNIWADPEAAQIVLSSGMRIDLVGWDVSRNDAAFSGAEIEHWRTLGPLGAFSSAVLAAVRRWTLQHLGSDGADLPDPAAMAVALDPTLIRSSISVPVSVDCSAGISRGHTVLERYSGSGKPPVNVVTAIDRGALCDLLHRTFQSGS